MQHCVKYIVMHSHLKGRTIRYLDIQGEPWKFGSGTFFFLLSRVIYFFGSDFSFLFPSPKVANLFYFNISMYCLQLSSAFF